MARSKKRENGTSDFSKEKDISPARRAREKKKRFSSPEIDKHIQMKWGLALLGEERAKQYLDWLRKRLEQCAR